MLGVGFDVRMGVYELKPKILVMAGSLRAQSFNKALAAEFARKLEATGAEVSLLDLKQFPLPVYDGDFEDFKDELISEIQEELDEDEREEAERQAAMQEASAARRSKQ